MIQISSLVETHTGAGETRAPEHSSESSFQAEGANSKKEKKGGALGVFSRILAALTAANTKTTQTVQAETGEAESAAVKAEGLRRNSGKAGFGPEKTEALTEKKKSAFSRRAGAGDSGEELFPLELPQLRERLLEQKTESFQEVSGEVSIEEAGGLTEAAGNGKSVPLQNRKAGNGQEADPGLNPAADPVSVPAQGTAAAVASAPGGKKPDSVRIRAKADAGEHPPEEGRAGAPELSRLAGEGKTGLAEPGGKERLRPGRAVENREKRQGRAQVEVRDLRSLEEKNNANPARVFQNPVKAEDNVSGMPLEFRGDLSASGETASAGEAVSSWEGRSAQSLSEFLARELHQNLNGDIVRQAHLVLRDGNEGSLRLSLKPESLGNVKIRLEMSENKVTGRIIVESEEAFRAFTQEIHALEEAFRESGYDAANLEMSLAGNGSGEAGGEGQGEEASSLFHTQAAALRYESAGENRINSASSLIWLDTRVNVLV